MRGVTLHLKKKKSTNKIKRKVQNNPLKILLLRAARRTLRKNVGLVQGIFSWFTMSFPDLKFSFPLMKTAPYASSTWMFNEGLTPTQNIRQRQRWKIFEQMLDQKKLVTLGCGKLCLLFFVPLHHQDVSG